MKIMAGAGGSCRGVISASAIESENGVSGGGKKMKRGDKAKIGGGAINGAMKLADDNQRRRRRKLGWHGGSSALEKKRLIISVAASMTVKAANENEGERKMALERRHRKRQLIEGRRKAKKAWRNEERRKRINLEPVVKKISGNLFKITKAVNWRKLKAIIGENGGAGNNQ
jgi:hypothetical protein